MNNFGGVTPRLSSRLLPQNGAQIASNLKPYSGELRSWRRGKLINSPTKALTLALGKALQSAYRVYDANNNSSWLSWQDDVDAVRGAIAGDTTFKLYYTGDSAGTGGPKKTNLTLATTGGTDYPHDYLEMGVPAPASTATVGIGAAGTGTTQSRTYALTYVTSWGEESGPSAFSAPVIFGSTGFTINLTALPGAPAGKYSVVTLRIYRSIVTSTGLTQYQFLVDLAIGTATYNDSTLDSALGFIAPSFTMSGGVLVAGSQWAPPPANLLGLTEFTNGVMVGFSGNLLCFCEPYQPHAWPLRYQYAVNFPIVGIAVLGSSVVVGTTGTPWIATGVHPLNITMEKLLQGSPCTSKRSAAALSFGVAYATPDGMGLGGIGGWVNATEPWMLRDEWQALCFPSTLIVKPYLDRIFGFFSDGNGGGGGFVFDKTNRSGPLVFNNYIIAGAWIDPATDALYYLQNNTIYQWDTDTINNSPFDWKSKVFILPKPLNYGACQVNANYASLGGDFAAAQAQAAADTAFNTALLAVSDTASLTAWANTTAYVQNDVRKDATGNYKVICTVAGTTSGSRPSLAGKNIGDTFADGGVTWKVIWQQQCVDGGELNGNMLNEFELDGSLLHGGLFSTYDNRSLQLQIYTDGNLKATKSLVSSKPFRLPSGFLSDTWEFRISGNIDTYYLKVAETMKGLEQV